MVRGFMTMHIVCVLVPAVLWIASIQVDYPDRFAIIWVAIFLGKRFATVLHPHDLLTLYQISLVWSR